MIINLTKINSSILNNRNLSIYSWKHMFAAFVNTKWIAENLKFVKFCWARLKQKSRVSHLRVICYVILGFTRHSFVCASGECLWEKCLRMSQFYTFLNKLTALISFMNVWFIGGSQKTMRANWKKWYFKENRVNYEAINKIGEFNESSFGSIFRIVNFWNFVINFWYQNLLILWEFSKLVKNKGGETL